MSVWIETTDPYGHVYRQRVGAGDAEAHFARLADKPYVMVRLIERIGSDPHGQPSWRVVRRWDQD